jgi:hypothetical protein
LIRGQDTNLLTEPTAKSHAGPASAESPRVPIVRPSGLDLGNTVTGQFSRDGVAIQRGMRSGCHRRLVVASTETGSAADYNGFQKGPAFHI